MATIRGVGNNKEAGNIPGEDAAKVPSHGAVMGRILTLPPT